MPAKTLISLRISDLTKSQIAALQKVTGMNQTELVSVAIDRMAREESKMDDLKYYPPTMSLFRDEYKTDAEYQQAYQDVCKHYGYQARVEGGWMFFEFSDDYDTWKRQK